MCYYRSVRNVIIYQRSFEKVIDRAAHYLNMSHNVVSAINVHTSHSGQMTGTGLRAI